MKLAGICLMTDHVTRLAAFYETLLQEAPLVEGTHYSFEKAQLSVYDDGSVTISGRDKTAWLMYYVADLMAAYNRLLAAYPGLHVISPPERRPWGAYSFQFQDPDGNSISLIEQEGGPGGTI